MTPHDTPQTPATQLPNRTTPTWEMELLLSGATVFALWQIAAAMAPFTAYLLPRLAPELASIGGVIYIYVASGVILIGLAFVIHLVLRAYWVALVGMHSVFPHGLRMERLRGGPIMRENLAARWQDMDAAIERADNRATVVFGLGIGVASVLIPITITVLATYGLVAAACWSLGRVDDISWVFPIVILLLLLPNIVVVMVDRWFGHRLARDGFAYRWCARTMRVYSSLGMGREANPLVTLYSSNVGERRGTLVVVVVLTATLFIAGGSLVVQRVDLGLGSFQNFPEPWRGMPGTVDGRHYASMHEPGTSPSLPYLPGPVMSGDYLRLVVPFVPARQGRQLAGCAGTPPRSGEARAEADHRQKVLACFGRLHTLTLDGRALELKPDWYTEPGRDVRGLIYMVPVHDLAPGRHELVITLPDPRAPSSDDELPLPDRIPFWR